MRTLALPIKPLLGLALLAGCVSGQPTDGTPYVASYTPGGLFYADTSTTFYADGAWSYVVAAYPDGSGRAEQTAGVALGAYEAALAALASPTAQELASERASQQTAPDIEPHGPPIDSCIHFDGTQTQPVPLYVCARASAAAASSAP